MGSFILFLLLTLSANKTELESVVKAQEAANTVHEQRVQVETLDKAEKAVVKQDQKLKVNSSKTKVSTKKQNNDQYKTYIVTAYTNGYESTQKHKGQKGYSIQANGKKTVEGSSIACPKSMKFGTKLYIKELDHTYTCSDRGSKITEGHLDVFFEDLDKAIEFGRRKMKVKIIKKG